MQKNHGSRIDLWDHRMLYCTAAVLYCIVRTVRASQPSAAVLTYPYDLAYDIFSSALPF